AAINLLLLAHGHRCEDIERMCCMNLSYHSELACKSIQLLKEWVKTLQADDVWGWLNRL
ncbi:hypothetical protein N338_13520, partial [Podiceps cristatus]